MRLTDDSEARKRASNRAKEKRRQAREAKRPKPNPLADDLFTFTKKEQ